MAGRNGRRLQTRKEAWTGRVGLSTQQNLNLPDNACLPAGTKRNKEARVPGMAVDLAAVACVPTLFRTLPLQRGFFDLGGRPDRTGDMNR